MSTKTDARTLIGNLIAGSGWTDTDDRLGRVAGEVADEILRRHAHELAKKIRAYRGALNGQEWHERAADLIDPEAA